MAFAVTTRPTNLTATLASPFMMEEKAALVAGFLLLSIGEAENFMCVYWCGFLEEMRVCCFRGSDELAFMGGSVLCEGGSLYMVIQVLCG